MVYSGLYKAKNTTKYKGDHTNIVYRSLWEKAVFQWCDKNPKVKQWSSEETIIPYYYEVDKKYHRYFVDMKIVFDDKILLVEIKPEKETKPPEGPKRTKRYVAEGLTYVKNMNKWEAANEYAKDRGWEFQVWTEKTLQEMKLLTKPVPGKLKTYKPLAPYRKKRRKRYK
jgi:hypothetical protein|tara:strand:- start:34 stop:540 length:507 start_codon:yes stop_codon:yes gene_type:complete